MKPFKGESNFNRAGGKQEIEKMKLTPEYVGKLIFWSFKLSQGESELQLSLFHYLHTTNPDWKMSEEDFKLNFEKSSEMIKKYFGMPKQEVKGSEPKTMNHQQLSGTDFTLREELSTFQRILNNDGRFQTKSRLLESIVLEFIQRDHKFMKEGRFDGRKDLSYTCDFIIQGSKTNVPDYDRMFVESRNALANILKEEDLENEEVISKLIELVEKYNQNNPDKKIDLTSL